MHRRTGKSAGTGARAGHAKPCRRPASKSSRRQAGASETSAALAELQTIYLQTPVGLCFLDRDLRYVKINELLARINGRPVADHIGRTVREVLPGLADAIEPLLKRVVETGEPLENFELVIPTPVPGSFTTAALLNYFPVRDAAGKIFGVNASVVDITERKQVEKTLRESQERLSLIFNNVKDHAIFSLDLNAIVTSWNIGAERVFGYTEAEIIGRNGKVLFTPEDRAEGAPERELSHARASNYSVDERWHLRKDGRRMFASGTVRTLKDEQGRLYGFVKVVQDITARHEIQQQLALRLQQQEALARLGQLALEGGDEQFLMDQTVRGITDTLGVEFAKVLELVPDRQHLLFRAGVGWKPGVVGRALVAVGEGSQSGFTLAADAPVVSDDLKVERRFEVMPVLREHGVRSSMTVVINGHRGQRPFGVLGACSTSLHKFSREDVNFLQTIANVLAGALERNQVERALASSERQFRELADAMPQIVWTTQPDGNPDYYNRRWFEYTGQSPAEALTEGGWQPVLHPADLPLCRESWSRSVKSGEPFEVQCRYRGRDGSYRWFLIRAVPVKDEQGNITRWFGSSTDIDDQRRSNEALKQARERLREHAGNLQRRVAERTATLQESVQSLESVLYHVAHDLRAPLRAMQGLTTLLLEEYAPRFDQEGRDYAERIVTAAGRMDTLIRDLLDYGRLGHMSLPAQKVDLEKLMKLAVDSLNDEIAVRGAHVQIQHPLLPVYANDIVLRQVVINLLSNALKFVAPGTAPRVRIWTETSDGKIRLFFQDNGIGIEPEHQQRIFRVFERLHRGEDFPGTGIGLAIVAKGMERMGGRVGVESQPGVGSRFWIEIPALPESNPAAG